MALMSRESKNRFPALLFCAEMQIFCQYDSKSFTKRLKKFETFFSNKASNKEKVKNNKKIIIFFAVF
jgi:hypothetical protein